MRGLANGREKPQALLDHKRKTKHNEEAWVEVGEKFAAA